MPGLGRASDRTFVAAFQSIDKAIINPWFLPTFLGALVFTGLAVAFHFAEHVRPVLPWIVAAFLLYLATFIITIAVNVPLNNDIKAAGDPTVSSISLRYASGSTRLGGSAGISSEH